VFEHIEDPEWLARELLRIVKPGGLIAAFTPNKFGYFAVAARMVPNRLDGLNSPEPLQDRGDSVCDRRVARIIYMRTVREEHVLPHYRIRCDQ
jgi:2-polyprenyl-3-methyl-5-hydroxy-6-metoxy-1,4-benzoquinol methylase